MRRTGIAVVLLAALVAIGLTYLHLRDEEAQQEEAPVAAEPEPSPPPRAEAPLPAAPQAPSRPEPGAPEEELPALGQSDAVVLRTLADLIGQEAVELFVVPEDVLRRAVVTADNLPQGPLPLRVRVTPALEGDFVTRREGGEIFLSEENHARYRRLVEVVEGLDPARAVEVYAHFYPLIQEAHEGLGHRGQFNDRLLAAVDDLLRAPAPGPPIRLVRAEGVTWAFADPALEVLSPGQKALIRMGPRNAGIVKAKLREIRSELVARSQSLSRGAGASPAPQ